jgi:hypothetical protein
MAAFPRGWREREGMDREVGGLDSEGFRPEDLPVLSRQPGCGVSWHSGF